MARDDSLLWMVKEALVKWARTRKALFAVVGTLALMAALAVLFSYQANAFPAADPYNVNPLPNGPSGPADAKHDTITNSGFATEGTPIDETIDMDGETIWVMEITFTFTDEAPSRRRFTNLADEFEVTVQFPDGETETKTARGTDTAPGLISFTYNWTKDGGMDWSEEGGNSIVVTVECTTAGNQEPLFNPFGLREIADNGNDYSLSVYYEYT